MISLAWILGGNAPPTPPPPPSLNVEGRVPPPCSAAYVQPRAFRSLNCVDPLDSVSNYYLIFI